MYVLVTIMKENFLQTINVVVMDYDFIEVTQQEKKETRNWT